MVMWFVMIVRVALTVLKGGEAHEPRSDDDGDDIEEELTDEEILSTIAALDAAALAQLKPLEEEVGVEAINLKGRVSNMSRYRKGSSSTSGVSLPGHSDRKELLGRIGCDKGA